MTSKELRSLIKEEVRNEMDNFHDMNVMKNTHKSNIIKSLDTFTLMYIDVALSTSFDNADDSGGEPLNRNYAIEDIEYETLEKMIKDCKSFQEKCGELYNSAGWNDGHAGYDFWLTRNGHGTGFWDRDSSTLFNTELFQQYGEEGIEKVGEKLTTASKSYGEYSLYAEDGIIYGYP